MTTIRQSSPTLQLNWQSFDVGAAQSVNFVQPGSGALAVNRIFASTPSTVLGQINANGQVWLINPNGVLFGPSARINVGGLVASTLDVNADSLDGNVRSFSGSGNGRIVNKGTIDAAEGGYVALLGNRVSNQGVISARLGTIALAGGKAVTLSFNGSQLVHVQIDASTLNDLAENRRLLVADGGQVIMTAGARDTLLASAVNNTGMVRAETFEDHEGKIVLLGGMAAGQVDVGGTLDASARGVGNGGAIETSAAQIHVAPDARITAAASFGRGGTWLVDPTNLTIDATAANTLSNTLQNGTSVMEQTTSAGASGVGTQASGAGDINVNAAINWTNAAANLTLQALNAINVNAPVSGAGAITMQAGTGNLSIGSGASIVGAAGVVLATSANFVNQAGSAAVGTGTASPWLIYSSDPRQNTSGGLVPSFIQYNAPNGAAPAQTGNGFLYSLAPTITLTGLTGSATKVYDGTTAASLAGANLTTTGLVGGDTIQSGAGVYASANAGSNIAVSVASANGNPVVTDSTGKIPVFGYKTAGSVSAEIGVITPAPLSVAIVGDPSKVYDGTASAALKSSNYGFSGFVAGQGATVNQASSVSYASADAGTRLPLNATLTSSNFIASSGTNLANYVLPATATGAGTITPAPVIIRGLVANDKVYDGTAADTLDASGASIFGLINKDSGLVSLNTAAATGTFATPNAGNAIAVQGAGFALTGTKAANYQIAPITLAASITPKSVAVSGVTANDKVYDATNAASLDLGNATLSGLVPSDAGSVALSTRGVAGSFGQSNVGTGLPVSASGFTLNGAAAGNYVVTTLAGLSASITPAPLTVAFQGTPTKIYDGSANAALSASDFAVSGFVGGQSATVPQASTSYATANAGAAIPVTALLRASDFAPGAGTAISNYTFPASIGTIGVIQPAPVVVNIVNNPSKVFDGTASATLGAGNYSVVGALPGQSIALSPFPATGVYASSNAGFQSVSAALTPGNFSAAPGTLLSNYALPVIATGVGSIAQKQLQKGLSASIRNDPTKIYDGTTTALIPAGDFVLSGFVGNDAATVSQSIAGQYATKNAGPQPVSASVTQSSLTAGPGTNLNNYSFPVVASGTGTIVPAPLAVSIVGNPAKVYNGDTIAHLTGGNFLISGLVAGESAGITPTTQFNYAQANAGNRTVSGSLVPGNYTAGGNTLLSNYVLATVASGPGAITPAPLYVLNAYATDKTYDTTAADTLDVSRASLSGVVGSDTGNVVLNTSTTGTFAQANAGNHIAVTASGFGIAGSAAGNYTLQPLTGLSANITPARLTVNAPVANDKVYDGTTLATISSNATLSGVLGQDSVTLTSNGTTGQFISPNVGTHLRVTTSGFTVSGPQAANYVVTQPSALFANITPAPINVAISSNPGKTYDASTSVTLGASDFTLTGFVGNQSATIPQAATSGYRSPNAGVDVGLVATLETSDYLAGAGTNLSNYLLPESVSGTLGQITPKVIGLTGARVYDGTASAGANLFGNGGQIAGINGQTLTLSGLGTLSTKNIGKTNALTSLGTLALGSGTGLASNYTLSGGADSVTITPATLTVLNTIASNKVYDGGTVATLQSAALNGVFGSDDVVLGNAATGTFNNKNAGAAKPVTTQMTVSGTDAANYVLTQPAGITASIAPLGVSVNATAANRAYNATATATVTLNSTGVIAGDKVTFADTSASFAQSDVANAVPVVVAGISAGGADAANYTLLNTSAAASANITPFVLNLSGTRVYDASATASANLFGTNGTLAGAAGQTLTLAGAGQVVNKNVGTNKAFATNGLAGFTLTGNGATKTSNYTLAGGTDRVTITAAPLTVTGTQARSKTYDGTVTATLSGATLTGVIGSDTVALGGNVTGQFNNRNVGAGKAVTTSMTVSGTDAANYKLTQPGGLTASITPLGISVGAAGIGKVYDSNTAASVQLSSPGVVAGDSVIFSDTAATFAQADVGNAIPVLVQGIGASGAGASNYTLLNSTATTSANITPFVLSLQGSRVYDATALANAGLFGTNGVLAGVNGQTLTLGGAGTLSGKDVGAQKPFAVNGLGGFTLTGNGAALASNYTLSGGNDAVTITPATLTVIGTSVNTKVYDATTAATLAGATLSGVLGVDAVTLGHDTTGVFIDKNVGAAKSVAPSAMTISGADSGDYVLVQPAGLTGSITPRPIIVNATAQNKTYDGTTAATATVAGIGVLPGDTVSFTHGAANFVSPNAGTRVGVRVNGIADGGADAANYAFDTTATTTANILPVVLNLTGTRTYDGTTGAAAVVFGDGGALTGVAGQTLTLSGTGTLTGKNVGAQIPFAANGLAGFTLTGNGDALASNYTLTGGIDRVTITPLPVTISATGQSKTYDATTAATVTLGESGIVPGDAVSFGYGSAAFASPNAGSAVPIAVTGITASGADARNYTISTAAATHANILPAPVPLTGTRAYDGTTSANASLFGNDGVLGGVAGQTLTLSGAGTLASKNVSAAQPFATNGLAGFTLTGNGAALASNYTLAGGANSVAITPKTLTIDASGQNKIYDGTTAARLGGLSIGGIVPGDDATIGIGAATFASPDAGTNIPVAVTGISGSGADIGNYTFASTATTRASITPAILNLTTTRTYDGTTGVTASLFGSDGVLTGVDGQTLTLRGTGTLATKNAGAQQPFAANGSREFTLTGNGGALASNYTLVGGVDWVTITPLAITLTATGQNKTYDGTNAAQVSLIESGVLTGDDIAFHYGAANFGTPNAGSNVPVQVTGITASGADAGNYSFTRSATTQGNIGAAVLDLTGTRVYDGNTDAPAAMFGNGGVLAGVNGETLTLTGSGTLSGKNVGTQIPFTAGLALTGNGSALASNYTFAGGIDRVTITPLALNLSAIAQNKTYDASTTAQIGALDVSGLVPGDSASFTFGGANFVTPNAGSNIPVLVAGIAGAGSDIGNYSFGSTVTTSATILPVALNLTGSRVYDGSNLAAASLFGQAGQLSGVNGETVTLSGAGALTGRNVGAQQPFATGALADYTLTGNGAALASNYKLTGGIDWVSITPRSITVTATGANKVYDGTRAASVGLGSSGVLSGDQVTFSAQSANFVSPNAGDGIGIAVTGIGSRGADAGNYVFNTSANAVASITPFVLGLTASRVYDAGTDARAGLFGMRGVLSGIGGDTLTLTGTGTLSGKNVGGARSFAPGGLDGFTLSGNGTALASNYTLAGGASSVTITPAVLTVLGTKANDLAFNGTVLDTLSGATLSGILGRDRVTLGNATAGFFHDPKTGSGKLVSTDMTLEGADAGNYTLIQPTGLRANIFTPVLPIAPGALASTQSKVRPDDVATPYGTAPATAEGSYAGNPPPDDKAAGRNVARGDFHPGLALTVINGGVRLPSN